jgi:MarR family transcriptional regulator, organic hydroperoxide resistance regulator
MGRTPGEEVIPEILKTAGIVRRRISKLLDPFGITPQQYNVLRILRGAGPAGLPTLDIGARLLEETPGITRLIDRMESHGWVIRERSRDDRRLVRCRLTEAGTELLGRIDPVVAGAPGEVLNRLGEADTMTLRGLLAVVRGDG